MKEEGNPFFYLNDDLESPMKLVDASGRVDQTYAFDEFGNDLIPSVNKVQPFGFTGYQKEEVGGLYYAQARRYNPFAGRFVSEDIIKGSIAFTFTLNRYVYCWNKPLELVDANGMFAITTAIIIGAVVGGLVGAGLEIYDQHKAGTLDFKSGKTWAKIAVSGAVGAVEGVFGATLGLGGIAIGVFTAETVGSFVKAGVIDGEQMSWNLAGNILLDSSINALVTVATAGIGKGISKLAPKLTSKFSPYLRNFISHGELGTGDMLDWLAKYAVSGAKDANEAFKLMAYYFGSEAAYDLLVNRANVELDSIINFKSRDDNKE